MATNFDYFDTLTEAQVKMYRLLVDYKKKTFRSPTIKEISLKTGQAKSTIFGMLRRLEKKGYIKVEPRKARGITILGEITYDRYSNSNKNYNETKGNYQYGSGTKNKSNRGSIWR